MTFHAPKHPAAISRAELDIVPPQTTEHRPRALPIDARSPGALCRLIRERRGWSQSDLGARLGVSKQRVHQIESGSSSLTMDLVMRDAEFAHEWSLILIRKRPTHECRVAALRDASREYGEAASTDPADLAAYEREWLDVANVALGEVAWCAEQRRR